MLQVFWTQKAEADWMRAWDRAPRSDSLYSDGVGEGPTQQQRTDDANQLDKSKTLDAALSLGEPIDGNELHRKWVSDLLLVYTLKLEPDDLRMWVMDFFDPWMP